MTCNTPPNENYAQLVTRHQRKIFWYVLSLVPNWGDAEDILQETNLVLWRKAGQYDPQGDFVAWACRMAYFEVLKFRERRHQRFPCLSEIFDKEIIPEAAAAVPGVDLLVERLEECVQRLPERNRELLRRRYAAGATTKSVAGEVGRSVDAVYKALNRIHQILFDCMNEQRDE